jgi:hypothetical protein
MSEPTEDKYKHLRDTSDHSPYTLVFITLTMQGLTLLVGMLYLMMKTQFFSKIMWISNFESLRLIFEKDRDLLLLQFLQYKNDFLIKFFVSWISGMLLSFFWIHEMPWYWFWTNYIIAAIFATAIHSFGHRHWSGTQFRVLKRSFVLWVNFHRKWLCFFFSILRPLVSSSYTRASHQVHFFSASFSHSHSSRVLKGIFYIQIISTKAIHR